MGTKTKITQYNIHALLFSSPMALVPLVVFCIKKRRTGVGQSVFSHLFRTVSSDAIKPQGRVTVAYAATAIAKTGI
jgi:hypothetical protein